MGCYSGLAKFLSVAKCLPGERSLQFFRFRGPRCVGQRDLYPFAILFRELPVEAVPLLWPPHELQRTVHELTAIDTEKN